MVPISEGTECRRFLTALLCAVVVTAVGCGGQAHEPEAVNPDGNGVDRAPPEVQADADTVSLVGFREFDPDLLIIEPGDDPQQPVVGFPRELFLKAARSSKPVQAALDQSGKNAKTASLEDWFAAAQKVATSTSWSGDSHATSTPVSFKLPGSEKTSYVDSSFLIGLTASELFGTKSQQSIAVAHIGGAENKIAALQLDSATASSFKGAYEMLGNDQTTGLATWSSGIGYCAGRLTPSPLLSKNARMKIGEISFGKPRAFPAPDKNISVPDSPGEADPVYWLDLFVTIRDLPSIEIENLTFRVRISPAECMALALVPDIQEKLGFQESPGCGLTAVLERYVQQEPRYKKLKPNIVAGGLRESDPYWTMSSGAIAETLYIFTVIVRVPAERETIDVVLSAEGKLQKHFLVRKDVIATERPVTLRVTLRAEKH